MEDPAIDESRVRKRQRVGDLDFSVASPFSDVKLVSANGTVLYGCRYILAARSLVCKEMLLGGMREAQPLANSDMVTIPFPGMRTEALQVLLDFCTSGCFSEKRKQERPVDVIHAARYFQLTDDMEELTASVIATLSFANVGSELDGILAETLSLALECLPTDLEISFFERLVMKIFSRSILDLPEAKLSSRALEFLLSKTLECNSEPWASRFPFYSSEYDIFCYVLRWSSHQLSEDGQQRLEKLLDGIRDAESFDIDKCVPGTAEVLESIATIAQPFLPLVDFRLIHPKHIALEIRPLEIVPTKTLFEALCHHAKAPKLSSGPTILYRGSYVLQWAPHACASGFLIGEDPDDGRKLYCKSETSGFARAYSCLNGGGEHSWIVTVSNCPLPGGIGIGFCSDFEIDYSNKWLGHSPHAWILDGCGRFWQNGRPVTSTERGITFGFDVTSVQVTVNLDTGTCLFTVAKAGQSMASVKLMVPELAYRSGDIPRLLYPAVSLHRSWGRFMLCPSPL